jgi:hypothetical protein
MPIPSENRALFWESVVTRVYVAQYIHTYMQSMCCQHPEGAEFSVGEEQGILARHRLLVNTCKT